MIHPTRTNLLLLKERTTSISHSAGILRARKQALIREFLKSATPFLDSREDIRKTYGSALDELSISLGHEGRETVSSISDSAQREMKVDIIEKSIWGLRYKDIEVHDKAVRRPDERGHDFLPPTPHLEESAHLFEKVLESMLELAAFENKLKRLGNEIQQVTRKINILEEKVLPNLRTEIKRITHHINERERETYYRLKKFKHLNL